MDRRKFMLGFGGTVIGAGALLGTGAFTSFNADRIASVSVAGDSTAYLGLDAGTNAGSYAGTVDSSLVTMSGESELQIAIDDSTMDGAGVNDEATLQIGEMSGDTPDPLSTGAAESVAFVMLNQFDQAIDVTVSDDSGETGTGADILSLPYNIIDTTDDTSFQSGADLKDATLTAITQDHEIHVVALVDTTETDDLSGSSEVSTLTISATPNTA